VPARVVVGGGLSWQVCRHSGRSCYHFQWARHTRLKLHFNVTDTASYSSTGGQSLPHLSLLSCSLQHAELKLSQEEVAVNGWEVQDGGVWLHCRPNPRPS
jgi:hypothetical protein